MSMCAWQIDLFCHYVCVCMYVCLFVNVGGMAQDKPSPMLFLTTCLHGNRHICREGGVISCCARVEEDSYPWSLCEWVGLCLYRYMHISA